MEIPTWVDKYEKCLIIRNIISYRTIYLDFGDLLFGVPNRFDTIFQLPAVDLSITEYATSLGEKLFIDEKNETLTFSYHQGQEIINLKKGNGWIRAPEFDIKYSNYCLETIYVYKDNYDKVIHFTPVSKYFCLFENDQIVAAWSGNQIDLILESDEPWKIFITPNTLVAYEGDKVKMSLRDERLFLINEETFSLKVQTDLSTELFKNLAFSLIKTDNIGKLFKTYWLNHILRKVSYLQIVSPSEGILYRQGENLIRSYKNGTLLIDSPSQMCIYKGNQLVQRTITSLLPLGDDPMTGFSYEEEKLCYLPYFIFNFPYIRSLESLNNIEYRFPEYLKSEEDFIYYETEKKRFIFYSSCQAKIVLDPPRRLIILIGRERIKHIFWDSYPRMFYTGIFRAFLDYDKIALKVIINKI